MLFSKISSAGLLSTFVPGAPLTSQRKAIHHSRRASQVYNSNWAGAVLIGNGYTSVSGQITVPAPQLPSGADSFTSYCASAWVGIDGDTCSTVILQSGLDFCVQGNSTSYSAWYEWYPDYAHDFSNIQISAGNVVNVSVEATSVNSGTVVIENLSTGTSVNHTFPPNFSGKLCEFNAEWIVEDFSINGGLAPFANFGSVIFSNAVASTGANSFGRLSATTMDIYQDQVLTSSSVTSHGVIVSYI